MNPNLHRIVSALKRRSTEDYLAMLCALFIVLAIVQTARMGGAVFSTGRVLRSLEAFNAPAPRQGGRAAADDFKLILEKGILGRAPQQSTGGPGALKLFGVLGGSALLGNDPKSIKTYDAGAELPGGAKLLAIQPDHVVIEKDGNEHTLLVFPEGGPDQRPSSPDDAQPAGHPPDEQQKDPDTKPDPPLEAAAQQQARDPKAGLVGRQWKYNEYVATFYDNNTVSVQGGGQTITGQYALGENNTINITVMNDTVSGTWDGATLIINGDTLQ
jgi:hypothetical protein